MRGKKLLYGILTGVKIIVASNSLELAHFNFFIPMIHFYLNGFYFLYFLVASNGYEDRRTLG